MKLFFQWIILVVYCLSIHNYSSSENGSSDMDIAAGKNIYVRCTGCHAPAYHRTGPKHCDLLGRRVGSVAEYEFTSAMKLSPFIWDRKTLDQFLKAPLEMFPKTSMVYAGIKSAKKRRKLIAFLSTLTKENPLCERQRRNNIHTK